MCLRSFLLLFFVWTENKGAFTVTKKLQRLIPVAVLPANCCKFLAVSRLSVTFSVSRRVTLLSNIGAYLWNGPSLESSTCFLETLHLIALLWIPTVLWQLRETTDAGEIKNRCKRARKLLTKCLGAGISYFVSSPARVRGSFLRKLVTGSCFVSRVATSPGDENAARLQTPSPLHQSRLSINWEYYTSCLVWRCVPQHPLNFSPQSAPRQTKEPGSAPLALSPRRPSRLYVSLPFALALCSTLRADAPTNSRRQQLFLLLLSLLEMHFRKWLQGARAKR